eukprot:c30534_g1_i1 orf=3-194(-)
MNTTSVLKQFMAASFNYWLLLGQIFSAIPFNAFADCSRQHSESNQGISVFHHTLSEVSFQRKQL